MLKAGVAIKNISPKKGVQLAGYPHCMRENTGIHNDVYATVVYLNNENKEIIFVGMDLLYFGKEHVAELRKKFGKHIVTFTTHTHCAPWASELLGSERADGMKENAEYVSFLLEQISDGIIEAMKDTFQAEVGNATGKCGAEYGIGGNRRDRNGASDDSLNVFAVREINGKIRAIISNYALHPTYLHEDVTEVSGDYPSYMRRFLDFAFPGSVFAFAQGCSGNQSSRYFRVAQNFEEAARAGTTLGVITKQLVDSIIFSSDVKLDLQSIEVSLPQKVFLSEEVAENNLKMAEKAFEAVKNADFLTRWNAELKLFGAQSNRIFAKDAKKGFISKETPTEIVKITIGTLDIIGMQGEAFVEYALKIKELNKSRATFVFSVTNGAAPGYLYTKEEEKIGGYEVGNSMFSAEAGDVLIETIKEKLL